MASSVCRYMVDEVHSLPEVTPAEDSETRGVKKKPRRSSTPKGMGREVEGPREMGHQIQRRRRLGAETHSQQHLM